MEEGFEAGWSGAPQPWLGWLMVGSALVSLVGLAGLAWSLL